MAITEQKNYVFLFAVYFHGTISGESPRLNNIYVTVFEKAF